MKSKPTTKTNLSKPFDFSATSLEFAGATPVAPHGLGGMTRDLFGNGRLFAGVGAHGGLLQVSYWGNQHLGGSAFFRANPGTAWIKLFRMYATIGGKRYYLTLNDTEFYPFGYRSRCEIESVEFAHELLLLPDALVQRVTVVKNLKRLQVQIEMMHMEGATAVNIAQRLWSDFTFEKKRNVLVASCRDQNPNIYRGDDSLSQTFLMKVGYESHDSPDATTWIGLGCDLPLHASRALHVRSKHYLISEPADGQSAAYFLAFAADRKGLDKRLKELSTCVHAECKALVAGYEQRLKSQPQVETGNAVLNSFFMQQPEVMRAMDLPDRPGAFKATLAGYFVWGWDGLTAAIPCALANAPKSTASILRFWQSVRNPLIGIPLQLTTGFEARLNNAFPAQCQFIASLYHYVATTGDLNLAEELLPTCDFLLAKCREIEVGKTGLVARPALWPDYPEAMGEDGEDISSLDNSLMYQGLRAMEYLYAALAKPQQAEECREWSQRLRVSFVKYFYDEEQGFFISSCSSKNFKPRKHYVCQAIFWITPFARELVSHAPERIAAFMDEHLRSGKCLLSMPRWDTAWMADGNQLGASYPTADYFYINVHKLIGDAKALDAWLGDVEWFWRRHTAPESFTPEAENEDAMGADNQGCKQLQACSTWYSNLTMGLAGMDFDHEGITFTPWGDRPLRIANLKLRNTAIDLTIRGKGNNLASLTLNGKKLNAGSRKILWSQLKGKKAKVEIARTDKVPNHPVIVRADGLRIEKLITAKGRLSATISGAMTSEIVIFAATQPTVTINGKPQKCAYNAKLQTATIRGGSTSATECLVFIVTLKKIA